MMVQGAQRMDQLFAQALAAGQLERDTSLNLPPPPIQELPEEAATTATAPATNAFQVQISGKDVNVYNFAMAHLRTLPGIDSATPQLINPEGTSYVLVNFHGDISQLAAALSARGWQVSTSGTVITMRSASEKPPSLPPPPTQPATPPQQPQPPPSQPPGQQ
jgi:hypothetical protein